METTAAPIDHEECACLARQFPRYVRVNTLRTSEADAVAQLRAISDSAGVPLTVSADDVVPALYLLPTSTDLHSHTLVSSGAIILQVGAVQMCG